jgi:hypothetical protein
MQIYSYPLSDAIRDKYLRNVQALFIQETAPLSVKDTAGKTYNFPLEQLNGEGDFKQMNVLADSFECIDSINAAVADLILAKSQPGVPHRAFGAARGIDHATQICDRFNGTAGALLAMLCCCQPPSQRSMLPRTCALRSITAAFPRTSRSCVGRPSRPLWTTLPPFTFWSLRSRCRRVTTTVSLVLCSASRCSPFLSAGLISIAATYRKIGSMLTFSQFVGRAMRKLQPSVTHPAPSFGSDLSVRRNSGCPTRQSLRPSWRSTKLRTL